MHEGKGPTVCLIDDIMAEIFGTVPHIVFKKDNAGDFGRECVWKLHFYEN